MSTIVVADDDADIRDLLVLTLEVSGHTVLGAGNGTDAVRVCRELRPDLAVLDLMMPGMTGLEACRALREDPDTAGISVVLLTGRTTARDRDAGLAVGADDYLAKPFSPRALASRVEALLLAAARD